MDDKNSLVCPFCKKVNSANSKYCSCGYCFNENEYSEREKSDNQLEKQLQKKLKLIQNKFVQLLL